MVQQKQVSIIEAMRQDIQFASQYYRAPTPLPEQWADGLKMARDMGLDAVQLRLQWAWHEKRQGEFYFDDIDELMKLAESLDLRVIIKFLLENAPHWVYRLTNCARIDNAGQPIGPGSAAAFYVGGWLPCFDNAALREHANRFIAEVVTRYRGRSALMQWNAWNEPRSRPLGECCCPESVEAYRRWLKNEFSTLETLNDFYKKAWGTWDDVRPPALYHPSAQLLGSDYAELHLWRRWAMRSITGRVAWVVDQIRQHDSDRPVNSHAGGCSVICDALGDTSDDSQVAGKVDFYGTSLVHHHHESEHHDAGSTMWYGGMHCDWIRSTSEYFWINELYTGSGNWKQPAIDEHDVRLQVLTALAHGAKGINLWQFHAERFGSETNDCGLLNLDDTITPRYAELQRIGAMLKKDGPLIASMRPAKSDLAIFYSRNSDLISAIEHRYLYPSVDPIIVDYPYKQTIQGVYGLFWRNNIACDWLHEDNLASLSRYQVVYLPLPIMLTGRVADALADFVRQGGTLISEVSPCLREDNTWASRVVPGAGLDRVFALTETNRAVSGRRRSCRGDWQQNDIAVTGMTCSLRLAGAKPIGRWSNDDVAASVHQFGQGQAVLMGFSLGQTYLRENDPRLVQSLRQLLGFLDVASAAPGLCHDDNVSIRVLTNDDQLLVFVVNHNGKAIEAQFSSCSAPGRFVRDLRGTADTKNRVDGAVSVRLAPFEVAVLLFDS